MSVPFKPRTVHPSAQSLHPLRYVGSIQTPDDPSSSPLITPATLCLFLSNPGRSIPQPSHYTHYAMPVPFKPRTINPPAHSLHSLSYKCSFQTPDGPSPSPVITPTILWRFHSTLNDASTHPRHYTHYAMPVPFNDGCGPVKWLN